MLIYGSTAIKYWFPDFKVRKPSDIDYICTLKEKKKSSREEEYYYLPEFKYIFENNKDDKYVDPNFLYTIKLSHLSWNIKWDKHMKDAMFLKEKGCMLDLILYKKLTKAWSRIHGDKKVNLNKENKSFFQKNIERKFDHDWLHEQLAFGKNPLHEKIREDSNSPKCSKILWDKLNEEEKFKCALEELYTLTCERFIFIDKPKPLNFAITSMLKKMIYSTTSGWFNLYLKLNFLDLIKYSKLHLKNKIKYIREKFY